MKKLLLISAFPLFSVSAFSQSPTPTLAPIAIPKEGLPAVIYPNGTISRAYDTTIRDSNGKIIGRVDESATGYVVRDANGKIVGHIEKPKQ